MRFWDSSAVVAIVFEETASPQIRELAEDGREIAVWWSTVVECTSAVARRERRGEIDSESLSTARTVLEGLASGWIEIPPLDRVRDTARRMVSVHDLRAADAFQLAAAGEATRNDPKILPFVTLDERLAVAARREGFPVLP